MGFAGSHVKFLGSGGFNFTFTNNTQNNLVDLSAYRSYELNQGLSLYWYEFWFNTTPTMAGSGRVVTMFGINFGVIGSFPSSLVASPYQSNIAEISDFSDPVIRPAYAFTFAPHAGPLGAYTFSGRFKLWGAGPGIP